MRQKTQLACALVRPAALLLLDEPVVGLDPPSQTLLHELLLERKQAGGAILLTTHQLGFAEGLADRGMLLSEGEVADSGSLRGRRGRRRGERVGDRMSVMAADAHVAAVRAWWRVRRPGAPLSKRLDTAYMVAITTGILGALLYGTASSALGSVLTPAAVARVGAGRRARRPRRGRALGDVAGPRRLRRARRAVPARRAAAPQRAGGASVRARPGRRRGGRRRRRRRGARRPGRGGTRHRRGPRDRARGRRGPARRPRRGRRGARAVLGALGAGDRPRAARLAGRSVPGSSPWRARARPGAGSCCGRGRGAGRCSPCPAPPRRRCSRSRCWRA